MDFNNRPDIVKKKKENRKQIGPDGRHKRIEKKTTAKTYAERWYQKGSSEKFHAQKKQ